MTWYDDDDDDFWERTRWATGGNWKLLLRGAGWFYFILFSFFFFFFSLSSESGLEKLTFAISKQRLTLAGQERAALRDTYQRGLLVRLQVLRDTFQQHGAVNHGKPSENLLWIRTHCSVSTLMNEDGLAACPLMSTLLFYSCKIYAV